MQQRKKKRPKEVLEEEACKTDRLFWKNNGYGWIYCIVFKVYPGGHIATDFQKKWSMRNLIENLKKQGLETFLFYGPDGNIHCKIRWSLKIMKKYAQRIDHKVKFDKLKLELWCSRGFKANGLWDPAAEELDKFSYSWPHGDGKTDKKFYTNTPEVVIEVDKGVGLPVLNPYEGVYGVYAYNERLEYMKIYESNFSLSDDYEKDGLFGFSRNKEAYNPFRGVDRITVLLNCLTDTPSIGGCGLPPLSVLTYNKCILAHFPLHENEWRDQMYYSGSEKGHLDDLKNYYGAYVAFYFAFSSHLLKNMIPGIMLGAVYEIWAEIVNPPSDEPIRSVNKAMQAATFFRTLVLFSVLPVWVGYFIGDWRRQETELGLEWGLHVQEEKDNQRPEFKGRSIPSPIDGFMSTYKWSQFDKRTWLQNSLAMMVIIVLDVMTILGIFYLRHEVFNGDNVLSSKFSDDVALLELSFHFIFAIYVNMVSRLLRPLALFLTQRENHRTIVGFDAAFLAKIFLFSSFNFYSPSLIFLAMDSFGVSCSSGRHARAKCFEMVQFTTWAIVLMKIVFGASTQMAHMTTEGNWKLREWFRTVVKRKKKDMETVQHIKSSSYLQVEREYDMPTLTSVELEIHFADIILYVGFTMMLFTATPLVALLSWVGIYLSRFFMAYEIRYLKRRPVPSFRTGLGLKVTLLYILAVVGILVNAYICFLQTPLDFAWPSWIGSFFVPVNPRTGFSSTAIENSSDAQYWAFVMFEHLAMFLFRVTDLRCSQLDLSDFKKKRGTFLSDHVLYPIETMQDDYERAIERETDYDNFATEEITFDDPTENSAST